MICLGCGTEYAYPAPNCNACEAKAVRHMVQYKHWPLEVSLSNKALAFVEEALRERAVGKGKPELALAAELHNTANAIRAHLQHVVEEKRAPKADPLPNDEELLS